MSHLPLPVVLLAAGCTSAGLEPARAPERHVAGPVAALHDSPERLQESPEAARVTVRRSPRIGRLGPPFALQGAVRSTRTPSAPESTALYSER
jgi:hypothetical protein